MRRFWIFYFGLATEASLVSWYLAPMKWGCLQAEIQNTPYGRSRQVGCPKRLDKNDVCGAIAANPLMFFSFSLTSIRIDVQ